MQLMAAHLNHRDVVVVGARPGGWTGAGVAVGSIANSIVAIAGLVAALLAVAIRAGCGSNCGRAAPIVVAEGGCGCGFSGGQGSASDGAIAARRSRVAW